MLGINPPEAHGQSDADVESNIETLSRKINGSKAQLESKNWFRLSIALREYCETRGFLEKWKTDQARFKKQDSEIAPYFDAFIAEVLEAYRLQKQASIDHDKSKSADEMESILEGGKKASAEPPRWANQIDIDKELAEKLACYKRIDDKSKKLVAFVAKKNTFDKTLRDPTEVREEKDLAAWNAWLDEARKRFEPIWDTIQKQEAAVRPQVESAKKAIEKGDLAGAKSKLQQARVALFRGYLPSAKHYESALHFGFLKNGLALEISESMARIAQAQKDEGALWAEAELLRWGRPWGPKEAEFLIAVNQAHQAQGTTVLDGWSRVFMAPPSDVVRLAIPLETTHKMGNIDMAASRSQGQACKRLNFNCTRPDYGAAQATDVGRFIQLVEPVSAAKGPTLRFDMRRSAIANHDCVDTKKIDRVDFFSGKVIYRKKCKQRKVTHGHLVEVARSAALKFVKKGDQVLVYGKLVKGPKDSLRVENPTFVSVERGGRLIWYKGVNL